MGGNYCVNSIITNIKYDLLLYKMFHLILLNDSTVQLLSVMNGRHKKFKCLFSFLFL